MTAEIAVLNKGAVALAADSKVTITGHDSSKGYDSVNKVFSLSKYHPVGIMIYGNAEFMDIPWETIIKMYRKNVGTSSFATVRSWSLDFIKFVEKFCKLEPSHRTKNVQHIAGSALSDIVRMARQDAVEGDVALDSPEFGALLLQEFKERISELGDVGNWLTEKQFSSFFRSFADDIVEVAEDILGHYETEGLLESGVEYASLLMASRHMSPRMSGVVVAGFGDDEYFPKLVEYETDGFIGAKCKFLEKDYVSVSRSMPGAVKAFAQKDMAERFMNGAENSLVQTMLHAFMQIMLNNGYEVLRKFGTKKSDNERNRELILESTMESMAKFSDDFSRFVQTNFISPVVSMVALLPKEEIANLAESLVALTSLKRRVSNDAETVGGPIDVCLISKGDGFIWIKRKHYFDPRLNNSFFSNYYFESRSNGKAQELGEDD